MAKDKLLKQLKGLKYNIGKEPIVEKKIDRTSQKGTREGETRITYIVKEETVERIRAIAKDRGQTIKATAQEALDNFIKQYDNDKK